LILCLAIFIEYCHVIDGHTDRQGTVRSLIIRFQITDTLLLCGEMAKKSENHKIWANFDPPYANLFGGAPKILKPVVDTPFQGLLLGKVWTMLDPKGVEKISPPPPIFLGEG